jgi:hypothetical protein
VSLGKPVVSTSNIKYAWGELLVMMKHASYSLYGLHQWISGRGRGGDGACVAFGACGADAPTATKTGCYRRYCYSYR